MPRITAIVATDAQARLKGRTTGHDDRALLRDAIGRMTQDRILELDPDAGEMLRKHKMSVTCAAKVVGCALANGESVTGRLLV